MGVFAYLFVVLFAELVILGILVTKDSAISDFFSASLHVSSFVNEATRFHILLKGVQMLTTPAGQKYKR